MLKNRKELMDCAQSMYEALLSRAAQRYFDNAVYTLVDRVGVECTRLEELFRPMWGLAPILNERELNITVDGKKMAVSDFYQHLMLEGTDSSSPNRFDRNVSNYDREFFANQSITEIAGYLTCVFFAREKLWDSMSRQQQDQIAAWVVKWAVYAVKHSWPNNHYWYPIICIEILKHLGYDLSEADAEMQTGFEVLDSLYIDHGWYSDGEFGRFDYYEAWAHHCYTLLYILIGDRSRPDYLERCRRYRERSEEFHIETGRTALEAGALLLTSGPRAAAMGGRHYAGKAELIADLPNQIRPGDRVLVKASHSMAFEDVTEALKEL